MNFARASAFNVVKRFAKKYNIDLSHLKNNKEYLKDLHNKQLIPLSEILIENSSYSRTCLKKRLYENGLKKRNCEKCGQGEIWNGEKISLILDHINGIRDDNRITNLRIVCPNCNATLETHCGKHLKNNHRCCSCGGKVSKNSKNCMECYKIILRDGIKKNTFYHKKIEKIDFKIQQYINKVGNAIKENDIDFSKLGWVQKVSELTGILPQKVSYFLKKHFQSFYEKHCYKRQYTGNIMKNYHLQIEQNKDERQNEINKRIQIILNSNIDFNKRGCITNLSKILKIHKGNCLKWIKRNMPELYSNLQINNIIKH